MCPALRKKERANKRRLSLKKARVLIKGLDNVNSRVPAHFSKKLVDVSESASDSALCKLRIKGGHREVNHTFGSKALQSGENPRISVTHPPIYMNALGFEQAFDLFGERARVVPEG